MLVIIQSGMRATPKIPIHQIQITVQVGTQYNLFVSTIIMLARSLLKQVLDSKRVLIILQC